MTPYHHVLLSVRWGHFFDADIHIFHWVWPVHDWGILPSLMFEIYVQCSKTMSTTFMIFQVYYHLS